MLSLDDIICTVASGLSEETPGEFFGHELGKLIVGGEHRGEFVQKTAKSVFEEYKGQYYVMVVNQGVSHDWLEGPDVVASTHFTFDAQGIFALVTYDVTVFRSGKFRLNGDGGYINWCFYGGERQNDQGQPDGSGKIVVFRA